MRAKDVLGKTGEQVAADYLQSCKSCGPADPQPELAQRGREIDIVAVERHVLVVCEVKSRTSTRYGSSHVLGRAGGSGRPCGRGRGGHRQRTGRDDPGRSADTALGLPAVQCRPFCGKAPGNYRGLLLGNTIFRPTR